MKGRKVINAGIYEQARELPAECAEFRGRCYAAEWNNVKSNLYYLGFNARRDPNYTPTLWLNFIATRRQNA